METNEELVPVGEAFGGTMRMGDPVDEVDAVDAPGKEASPADDAGGAERPEFVPEGMTPDEFEEAFRDRLKAMDDEESLAFDLWKEAEHDRAQAKAEAQADAVPETVKVGEEDVAFSEVAAAYEEVKGARERLASIGLEGRPLSEALGLVEQYVELAEQFGSGKESAAGVIARMQAAYIQQYGEDAPEGAPKIDLRELDVDDMTATELALYRVARESMLAASRAVEARDQAVAEYQKLNERVARFEKAPSFVKLVKAMYPDADVTGDALLRMMDEQGVSDPVKAYKLAKHDEIVAAARAKGAEAPRPAGSTKAPVGNQSARVYDPDKLTVDEIMDRRQRGWVSIEEAALANRKK